MMVYAHKNKVNKSLPIDFHIFLNTPKKKKKY